MKIIVAYFLFINFLRGSEQKSIARDPADGDVCENYFSEIAFRLNGTLTAASANISTSEERAETTFLLSTKDLEKTMADLRSNDCPADAQTKIDKTLNKVAAKLTKCANRLKKQQTKVRKKLTKVASKAEALQNKTAKNLLKCLSLICCEEAKNGLDVQISSLLTSLDDLADDLVTNSNVCVESVLSEFSANENAMNGYISECNTTPIRETTTEALAPKNFDVNRATTQLFNYLSELSGDLPGTTDDAEFLAIIEVAGEIQAVFHKPPNGFVNEALNLDEFHSQPNRTDLGTSQAPSSTEDPSEILSTAADAFSTDEAADEKSQNTFAHTSATGPPLIEEIVSDAGEMFEQTEGNFGGFGDGVVVVENLNKLEEESTAEIEYGNDFGESASSYGPPQLNQNLFAMTGDEIINNSGQTEHKAIIDDVTASFEQSEKNSDREYYVTTAFELITPETINEVSDGIFEDKTTGPNFITITTEAESEVDLEVQRETTTDDLELFENNNTKNDENLPENNTNDFVLSTGKIDPFKVDYDFYLISNKTLAKDLSVNIQNSSTEAERSATTKQKMETSSIANSKELETSARDELLGENKTESLNTTNPSVYINRFGGKLPLQYDSSQSSPRPDFFLIFKLVFSVMCFVFV